MPLPGRVSTYVYYTGKGRNANGIHTPAQYDHAETPAFSIPVDGITVL